MSDTFDAAELAMLMAELDNRPGVVNVDSASALQSARRALYLAAYNEICMRGWARRSSASAAVL